jgi:asparagine synthase (glutamine-hydrolysing)
VLLSGGVDSSLITAIASNICSSVKTFNVGFPGFSSHDETRYARLIARAFKTEHIELEATKSTPEILPALAIHYDEPVIDSSMVPTYLISQLVRRHCKVALGGDGGDELFGGYVSYSRMLWTCKNLSWIPSVVRSAAARFAENVLPVGFKGRNYLISLAFDTKTGLPLIASHFDRASRRRLLPAGMAEQSIEPEEALMQCVPAAGDLLQRATRMDFIHYLPEDILVKVDRASMANSLEVRAPFLDRNIIEFAFGKVPARLKAGSAERKILLRKLADRLLPKEFDGKRKQGFGIPLRIWIKAGPWREFFRQVLFDGSCMFERREVELLMREPRNSERLFGLVLFELWRRQYVSG